MSILGDRIVRARERKNWTQGQLATYAQLNQSYLSLIEGGKRDSPSLDHLRKITRALETSIDYLIGLTEDPRPLAVVQSSESRELASQIGGLLADPDIEQLFRLILRMTPEQKANMRAFALFLMSSHSS